MTEGEREESSPSRLGPWIERAAVSRTSQLAIFYSTFCVNPPSIDHKLLTKRGITSQHREFLDFV